MKVSPNTHVLYDYYFFLLVVYGSFRLNTSDFSRFNPSPKK